MPGKNIQRTDVQDYYYHVYNRGVNKDPIFRDEADYVFFEQLLERYLIPGQKDKQGRKYKDFQDDLELISYCLMPNHFHFLFFQKHEKALANFMKNLCTAYTSYFNTKYKRRGPLYESAYKASIITQDVYLEHITRYIHLNPVEYLSWKYSSLRDYFGERRAWIKCEKIFQETPLTPRTYRAFVADYKANRDMLANLKYELANL